MNTPYQLHTCHRPVLHSSIWGGQLPVQHCYAKLVNADGQTLDSISYDGLEGVSEQPNPNHSNAQCETVSPITQAQWQHLKQQIHQHCQADNFSLTDNNCCSCLSRVLQNTIGTQPHNLRQAEQQIQHQSPYVIIETPHDTQA